MIYLKNRVLALTFIAALGLAGCNTTDDSNQNAMQEDSTEPTMRREADTRGVEPSSAVNPIDNDVSLSTTNPSIGGYEMMPSQSIVENITSNAKLSTLAGALRKADLVNTLDGTGPYTVFAPSNEAFEGLPESSLEDLMAPENKAQLVELLKNHVVAGQLTADRLQDGSSLKTIGGEQLKVTKQDDRIMINGAEVEVPNAQSRNGVIHVINKVLTVQE